MSQFIAYPERYEHDDDYGPHDPKDARAAKWSMRIGAAVGMGAIASGLAASIYLIVEVSEGSSNNELRAQQINTQLKEQGYTPGIVGISLVQKRSFEYLGKNPVGNSVDCTGIYTLVQGRATVADPAQMNCQPMAGIQ